MRNWVNAHVDFFQNAYVAAALVDRSNMTSTKVRTVIFLKLETKIKLILVVHTTQSESSLYAVIPSMRISNVITDSVDVGGPGTI